MILSETLFLWKAMMPSEYGVFQPLENAHCNILFHLWRHLRSLFETDSNKLKRGYSNPSKIEHSSVNQRLTQGTEEVSSTNEILTQESFLLKHLQKSVAAAIHRSSRMLAV